MTQLLLGSEVAARLGAGLRARIGALARPPGLAVVRVGEDPASALYVKRKAERASKLGFVGRSLVLPATVDEAALLQIVGELNADPAIDGILVQLPLPAHIRAERVLDALDPAKDVDGFHPENLGRLAQGRPRFVPCTPLGVMALLREGGVALSGARALVIGRSNIVGRPMAMLLEQAHATVTVAHSRSLDLPARVAEADVVVAAVGRARVVQGGWLKPGAAVIDVGINHDASGLLCGDVDEASAIGRAGLLTPVPGGVGPMTIAMLMHNTVASAEARQRA